MINRLVHQKTLKNANHNFLESKVMPLKRLVLFDEQSKTQRCSVFNDTWQRKAANPLMEEAGTGDLFSQFFFENWKKKNGKSISKIVVVIFMFSALHFIIKYSLLVVSFYKWQLMIANSFEINVYFWVQNGSLPWIKERKKGTNKQFKEKQ